MARFEVYFNRMSMNQKIRVANRRIQQLELDLKWCEVMDVDMEDTWFLFDTREIADRLLRWIEVRDRLVWDREEVRL